MLIKIIGKDTHMYTKRKSLKKEDATVSEVASW